MNRTTESSASLQALQTLKGILIKPYGLRTEQEKAQTISILEENNYFRYYISDSSQRQEYIGEMAQYLRYTYYPKGALVGNQGDYGGQFGIILRGHAFVYAPKKKNEFEKDLLTIGKNSELIEMYRKYLEAEGFGKKLKKWMHLNNSSGRRPAIVDNSETSPRASSGNPKSLEKIDSSLRSIVDQIMSPDNIVATTNKKHRDLTLEDKYLILHHNGSTRNYFKSGIATYKKVREARGGDTIADICLTTDLTLDQTIIATEDLYVITISRENFRSLALSKVFNMVEKRTFLWQIFPQLTLESIIKLCAYVEERAILNWDNVYREGDEADAIYIVKEGEVQLVTFDQEEKKEMLEVPSNMNYKSKKFQPTQKLIVGSIEVGGIFGEDEVINKTKRKYNAICSAALTFLYVLRQRTFYELFENYFSYISQEFKSALDAKSAWRSLRMEHEKKMAEEVRALEMAPTLSQEIIATKTARLMEETEAEYRKIRVDRPELIFETKTTNVLKYEQRKSRIYSHKVDIIIYDCDMNKKEKEEAQQTDILPLKLHQKRASASPEYNNNNNNNKKSPLQPPSSIHKVKSTLFEQNQDFRKWKKYYDFLYSTRPQPKTSRPSISINSITNPKPATVNNLMISSCLPKLNSHGEMVLGISQTNREPPKTLNELFLPSDAIPKSCTNITSPSIVFLNKSYRNTSTSPKNSERKIPSIKEFPSHELENTKLTPGGVKCFQRVLSSKPRRKSIEVEIPEGNPRLMKSPSQNSDQESSNRRRPSLQIMTSRGSVFTQPKAPTGSMSTKAKIKASQTSFDKIGQMFVMNRGKEDPKVMVFQHQAPPVRIQSALHSKHPSRANLKPKDIMTGNPFNQIEPVK